MKLNFPKEHLIALAVFIVLPMIYFSPLLEGKKISQPDIVNWQGGARELLEYRKETGQETYWTNTMFSGMPTYQLGAHYKNNIIRPIDSVLRFLPRPADYVFICFLSFYIMLLCIPIPSRMALIGALAYGLTTYLFLILAAGHNAKAHALGYMPLVFGSYFLLLRDKKWAGLALASLAFGLEIYANHYQMFYYGLMLLGILILIELYDTYKSKQWGKFAIQHALFGLAMFIGIMVNAGRFITTYEYSKYSTRGKSELKELSQEQTSGLSFDYITQWSYGITETLDLVVPRLMGGATQDKSSKKEKVHQTAQKYFPPEVGGQVAQFFPTYWGDQPFVAGPAYQGVVLFFLFIMAIFIVKGKWKWWLIAGSILSVALAWGKNFPFLTKLFIEYFPFYSKFRAVASILVIFEFTMPLLAVLGFAKFMESSDKEERKNYLKNSSYIVGGLLLLFLLAGKVLFAFTNSNDMQVVTEVLVKQAQMPEQNAREFITAIKQDRYDMFFADVVRSILLVALLIGSFYLYINKSLKREYFIIGVTVLLVADLYNLNKDYLNNDNFKEAIEVENPITASAVDEDINRDGTIYRVFNSTTNFMSDASTSFFHFSIGGYHGAKIRRYQELMDFVLPESPQKVFNMLNAKYIITSEQTVLTKQINENAMGNAWFVNGLETAENADEEIKLLNIVDIKEKGVVAFKDVQKKPLEFKTDSLATVELAEYAPNSLRYVANNANDGFAVFSEIYYPKGWKCTIDDKPADIYQVNFVLRGVYVPKGKHAIVFTFDPESVHLGNKIALVGSILLLLSLGYSIFRMYQENKKEPATAKNEV